MTGTEIRSRIGTIDREIVRLQAERERLVAAHEGTVTELRKAGAVSGAFPEKGGNTVREASAYAATRPAGYP